MGLFLCRQQNLGRRARAVRTIPLRHLALDRNFCFWHGDRLSCQTSTFDPTDVADGRGTEHSGTTDRLSRRGLFPGGRKGFYG